MKLDSLASLKDKTEFDENFMDELIPFSKNDLIERSHESESRFKLESSANKGIEYPYQKQYKFLKKNADLVVSSFPKPKLAREEEKAPLSPKLIVLNSLGSID